MPKAKKPANPKRHELPKTIFVTVLDDPFDGGARYEVRESLDKFADFGRYSKENKFKVAKYKLADVNECESVVRTKRDWKE